MNNTMFLERRQVQSAVYKRIFRHRTIELKNLYTYIERRFDMTGEEIFRKDPKGTILIEHEVR